jgi:hypothetical protein
MKSEEEIRQRLKTMEEDLRWNKTINPRKNPALIHAQKQEVATLKWVLEK